VAIYLGKIENNFYPMVKYFWKKQEKSAKETYPRKILSHPSTPQKLTNKDNDYSHF
jgi:hypothetical protein